MAPMLRVSHGTYGAMGASFGFFFFELFVTLKYWVRSQAQRDLGRGTPACKRVVEGGWMACLPVMAWPSLGCTHGQGCMQACTGKS